MPSSLAEILGYVTNLMGAWGLMPYVQAGMFITLVAIVIRAVINAMQK
jgi:hypothetical protein